jgi:hypothetical protein
MNSYFMINGLQLILSAIPKEFWKEPLAEFLDSTCDRIKASENKIDDISLPLIKRVREELDLD